MYFGFSLLSNLPLLQRLAKAQAVCTASRYLMITGYMHPLPEGNYFGEYPLVIRAGFSEPTEAKSTDEATHNFMMPIKSLIKSNALCIPKRLQHVNI